METLKRVFLDAWGSLQNGFTYLWDQISGVLPNLIIALIVLVVGSWVAVFVGDKVGDLVRKGKIDSILDKTILYPLNKALGVKVVSSKLIGEFVKWILLISVFIAVFDLLGMQKVIDFFGTVLAYLPTAFIAAFIVVVGALLANFVAGLITIVTKGEHEYLSSGIKLAINMFALLSALILLLSPIAVVASQLMGHLLVSGLKSDILFIGVVILFVLAFKEIVVSSVKDLFVELQKAKSRKGNRLDTVVKIER